MAALPDKPARPVLGGGTRVTRFPTAIASRPLRRTAPGDLRLSRLHPLLRVDPRWQVHREAQDAEQPPDAQADGGAPGSVAVDAHAAGRPVSLVFQRAARPLRLLRHAA